MKIVAVYSFLPGKPMVLPLAECSVPAGFPSPAEDYADKPIDLAAHLVRNPAATVVVRAKGDSMKGAGINDGALLVVDRSVEATDGRIVIAVVDGEFTVKRLRRTGAQVWLEAANARYKNIEVSSEDMIWGVVTNAINSL